MVELGQAKDLASCVPNAWYYDHATTPPNIKLCPQTCDVAKTDISGKIELMFGCQTRPAPPPK